MEADAFVGVVRAWSSAALYAMFAVYMLVRLALFLADAVHDAWPDWLDLDWPRRRKRT